MDGLKKRGGAVKILLVTGSFPPMKCGVGDYTYKLAKSLAMLPNMHIAVATSSAKQKAPAEEGIEVFPCFIDWGVSDIFRFIRVIRAWVPDIVHIQYPTQGYFHHYIPWFLPAIVYLMKGRVVQTWHEGYSLLHMFAFLLKAVIPGKIIVVRPCYKQHMHYMLRWVLWFRRPIYIQNASSISKGEMSEQAKKALKDKYLQGQTRLVVFFGFIYPHKGVELLFDIADQALDHIVIAGELNADPCYAKSIEKHAYNEPWRGKTTITGFLPEGDVARLLAIADAVILPFKVAAGEWNTSVHAAVLNGAFVITTSVVKNGYNHKYNIYYSKIDDIHEMRTALAKYSGCRREFNKEVDQNFWGIIANDHLSLYAEAFASGGKNNI
jgi:glycosyltransferase involved in cell wall biosynthesis